MYNKINVNSRGLASMEIDSGQYGSFLIPVIMTKLPQDLRMHVAHETDREVWEIDELMSLLRKEVEAREATEMIKLLRILLTAVSVTHLKPSYCSGSVSKWFVSEMRVLS